MTTNAVTRPWYREPWPWILMAGPSLVIVAGVITMWIAFASWDGQVVDDYYKQGLEINRTFARSDAAAARGYEGELVLEPQAGVLKLRPGARLQADGPSLLRLAVSHATLGGRDQRVDLMRVADGSYEGRIAPLAPGRWHFILEDVAREWRIRGEMHAPEGRGALLRP